MTTRRFDTRPSHPTILTLADADHGKPGDWLARWSAERDHCVPADLGRTDPPNRNAWATSLGAAIRQADGPVILVARGLSCLAVAWWAALERPLYGDPVAGALLVAPPSVDTASSDLRMVGFGPAPKLLLPFPSVVVASRNDPLMTYAGAKSLASFWGSHCIDGGEIGSAGADADLGEWDHGQHALNWLLSTADDLRRPAGSASTASNVVAHPALSPRGYDLSL
ncbi:alpha/beta hydrolase [Sphingobium phenoxybenzoativorans]|uniref:Alpha/beta hydrolase n=1 Tax=Sphingobium phenoxybenzoativorans TaxID=1592790 RepID=A0A975Q2Y4_9SPHN|nr:alpha/beta hydrolase [Sphingobium phenoxybenzoativorans]QUT07480.1 alpha/beta hydrolase [Sphingobium phenoxybenzoativorans]